MDPEVDGFELENYSYPGHVIMGEVSNETIPTNTQAETSSNGDATPNQGSVGDTGASDSASNGEAVPTSDVHILLDSNNSNVDIPSSALPYSVPETPQVFERPSSLFDYLIRIFKKYILRRAVS